jgi:predicted HicB family RNase H-like nuclease
MAQKTKIKPSKEKMIQFPIRVTESLHEKIIMAMCFRQNALKRQVSKQEFVTDLIEKGLKAITKES